MKKLLMSSVVLLIFSASMFLFQASCKKDAGAQTNTTVTAQPLGIILFEKSSRVTNSSGVQTDVYQFFTANYDGSIIKQIPVTLPTGVVYYGGAHLTPDGKKLFLYGHEVISALTVSPYTTRYKDHIYSVNIDGSSFTEIVGSDVTTNLGPNTTTSYGIAGVDGAY